MRITETFSLCYSEVGVGVDDFRVLIFKILKFKNDVGQNSLFHAQKFIWANSANFQSIAKYNISTVGMI